MPNALPRPLRTLSRFALASLTAVGITPPVLAADPPGAIEKMLVEDSSLTLHLRTYTMDRRKPGPVLNEAWAAGGWLDYRWGWLGDMLGFGLVGYTSQPLWAPSDAAGTLLLTSTQDGYPVPRPGLRLAQALGADAHRRPVRNQPAPSEPARQPDGAQHLSGRQAQRHARRRELFRRRSTARIRWSA